MRLLQNWTRVFRRSCYLGQLLTDGQLMKTDHKSSPCHYVAGELKQHLSQHTRFSSVKKAQARFKCAYLTEPSLFACVCVCWGGVHVTLSLFGLFPCSPKIENACSYVL